MVLSEGEIKRVEEAVARVTGRGRESEGGIKKKKKIEVIFLCGGKKALECIGKMCNELWYLEVFCIEWVVSVDRWG